VRIGSRACIGFFQLVLGGIAAGQGTPAASSPLLGTWEAVNRSAGGLGSTIAFAPDNVLTFTIGVMVDMKYRHTSDSLVVTDADGRYRPDQFRVLGDTLVVTRDGRELRETRVGPAVSGEPILGHWTYIHSTGVPAFEEFTRSGEFHLRIPIRTLQGTYVTAGNSAILHLIGSGGGDRSVTFAVVGDTLQLSWDGQTTRYLRADPLSR
jgi:hypothetical protein